MNRKMMALMLAGMMLFGILAAGCQPSEPGTTPPSTTGTSGATTPSSSTEPEKKDYGTIVIYSNEGGASLATSPSDPAYLTQLHDYILEQSGVDVQYIIPPNDTNASAEKLNMLLASGDVDAFKGSVPTYVSAGAIQPVGDLVEQFGPNLKKLWPDDFAGGWAGMKTIDGTIWGVPNLPALAGCTVYLRTDMMQKVGTQTPQTIDELEKVLQDFQAKDPVGGGQTIPLLADYRGLNMAIASGYMDVGYDWTLRGFYDESDGKYKPLVFAEGYKDFVAEMADWYKQGLIYKESFTINRDRQLELVGTNRVAASAVWYTTMTTPVETLKEQDASIDLVVPEQLSGPKGYAKSMSDTSQAGWLIAKKAKNPEGVIRYLDWVQSDMSNYLTVQAGFENDTWKYVEKKDDGTAKTQSLVEGTRKYNGEFWAGGSFAMTLRMQGINAKGEVPIATRYISDYITNNKLCKTPSTFGFTFFLDMEKINAAVSQTDMNTYIEGETVKFIMGSRPMSEWETFLGELDKVGLQKWIEAFTQEYGNAKPQ